jgi:transposase
LRDLTRRRIQLTEDATRERNRVQKLLEQVNVKIGNVLTDVFGVSGQEMILALLEGDSTPAQIAGLARGQAQRKIPQLIEALEGHRMSDHCGLLIRSCLRHLGCLQEEIEALDDEILGRMETPPFESAFALLQTVPGVGRLSAATIWLKPESICHHSRALSSWPAGQGCVRGIGKAPAFRRGARLPMAIHICVRPWFSAPGPRSANKAPCSPLGSSNWLHAEAKSVRLWRLPTRCL